MSIATLDTPRNRAHKAITSGELSKTEEIILRWQWDLYGDFYALLLKAISLADEENLERLARGFNDEVVAVRAYRTTWIAESLRERGLL